MVLSEERFKIRNLANELLNLLGLFLKRKKMIKGGVYRAMSKCGKENCKCKRKGELHKVWRLYWSEGGKSHIKTIKEEKLDKYKDLTSNYIRFRKGRARMVKIHKEMMKAIDIIEKGLIEREKW